MTSELDAVVSWSRAQPPLSGDLRAGGATLASWHEAAAPFLPALADGGAGTATARAAWRAAVRAVHGPFVRRHRDALLAAADALDPVGLVRGLGARIPGLLAGADQLAEDAARPLGRKVGHEYRAAVLLSELLAAPSGARLLEAARRPTPGALDRLTDFRRHDALELAGARITRDGAVARIEIDNPDALNAETDAVLDALEICADVALLDDRVEVCVLRGSRVRSRKYAGRRVFCSGIHLTQLHQGQLSYLYYVRRELGLVSKLYRGLHLGDDRPALEKPWIAAVDAHAVGGGCQLLLVMDHVIAEQGSFLSLPARREGIIPGAANLRLRRFVGDPLARRMILLDREVPAESPEGRLLVDEIVPPDRMDAAIEAAAGALGSSGLVSLAANRKAMRIAQEPIDVFRDYMAHFALAQADCHFSPALIANLERHWLARRPRDERPSA